MTTINDKALDALTRLPEEAQGIALAISVLIAKYQSLPQPEQQDLFRLLLILAKSDDVEEQREIRATMLEILSRRLATASRLQAPEESAARLASWKRHIGTRIREFREAAGLSQTELAEKADLPQSHISRLENALHSPTRMTLEKIAKALDRDVRELDVCEE